MPQNHSEEVTEVQLQTALIDFATKLRSEQTDLLPEFAKALEEDLLDLYA
jgi:hypothetical protein